MKPRALDLFCGAGGVSKGLVAAGFDVIGVDLEPQSRYPYTFVQANALTYPLAGFDLIWASPPCQASTALRFAPNAKKHFSLIAAVRVRLRASGLPYVIENVEGAPLINPITLCGSMFGLSAAGHQLRRHRIFESSFTIPQPKCQHTSPVIGVYGGHVRCRSAHHGGRQTRDFVGADKPALARECMGIDWMTMAEISQAIPPAYAEHIGRAAIEHINAVRREEHPLYASPPSLAAPPAPGGDALHPDDMAVEAFADAMSGKLSQKRTEGRGGWDDPNVCSADDLSRMLRDHVEKGDPVDVANFCMMLHQRGERIASIATRPTSAPMSDAVMVARDMKPMAFAAEYQIELLRKGGCATVWGKESEYSFVPLYGSPALKAAREALEAARQFITNGVEFGFIRMPDKGTPDSAHETLPKISAALAALPPGDAQQEGRS